MSFKKCSTAYRSTQTASCVASFSIISQTQDLPLSILYSYPPPLVIIRRFLTVLFRTWRRSLHHHVSFCFLCPVGCEGVWTEFLIFLLIGHAYVMMMTTIPTTHRVVRCRVYICAYTQPTSLVTHTGSAHTHTHTDNKNTAYFSFSDTHTLLSLFQNLHHLITIQT